jgi:hypothetical protein
MALTRPRFNQFDTTISSISDPITVLNKSSTNANIDVGFIINRNAGVTSNVALFWQESSNTFALAYTSNSGELTGSLTNSNIIVSQYADLRVNSLSGNISGSSITITGNINAGNLIATNLTGTLLTASQTNITTVGNLTALSVAGATSIIGIVYANSVVTSTSNVTGALRVSGLGGIGVGGNLYVGQRVGYVWGANNVSSVYQVFNNTTNSLDTVFG